VLALPTCGSNIDGVVDKLPDGCLGSLVNVAVNSFELVPIVVARHVAIDFVIGMPSHD
jgi:hypothetical protein